MQNGDYIFLTEHGGAYSLVINYEEKGKVYLHDIPFFRKQSKTTSLRLLTERKTEIVRSTFEMGKGDFISSAKTTKIAVWFEEVDSSKRFGHMTLNGFGK